MGLYSAFILTEEMDNCAEDYRQTDQHTIAAMNNEPYEVPPAYSLPDRMRDYYEFLQKPDVHPLIKAAVAQAYLLVIRPFPEGNERLSRMMSSAVLLRCGYDFFRNISISAMIAKESYRYYKCMCEIIRSENGGDLTYFLEYFLELLVRAIDARKERLRRREQEALDRERELARQPLQKVEPKSPPVAADIEVISPKEPDGAGNCVKDSQERMDIEDLVKKPKNVVRLIPLMPLEAYLGKINNLKFSPNAMSREMPMKIRMMLDAGLVDFSAKQWSEITSCDPKQADYECRFLYEKGFVGRERIDKRYVYSLRILSGKDTVNASVPGNPNAEPTADGGAIPVPFDAASANQECDDTIDKGPPEEAGFYQKLHQMEISKSDHVRKTAAAIRDMLAKGITRFSGEDWSNITGMDMKRRRDSCDYLVAHRMVLNMSKKRNQSDYVFLLQPAGIEQEQPCAEAEPDTYSPILIACLQKMVMEGNTERDQRIGHYILRMIDEGTERIMAEDWMEAFHVTRPVCMADLRRAVNLGFLRKDTPQGDDSNYTYAVHKGPYEEVRCSDLTRTQQETLSRLYVSFKKQEFTIKEGALKIGCKENSLDFHLCNFTERGIISTIKHPEYPGHALAYRFEVTPKDHPMCFESDLVDRLLHPRHTTSYQAERVPLAAASG